MRTALTVGLALLAAAPRGAAQTADTIVPEASRVPDAEARLIYARMLSYSPATTREAVAAYERILQEAPANTAALVELAELLWRQGDASAAEQRLRAAIAQRPGEAAALIVLARLCLATDRAAEAEKLIAEAARREPLPPEALRLRAGILSRLGRHAEAEQVFAALLADSRDPELLNAAADARLAAGDITAARDLFARTLALDGARAGARRNYALTLAWTGRDAEARERLATVLAAAPADYEAAVAYGEVIARLDGPEAASTELRRRAESDRRNPAWLVRLAEIETARGHAVRSRALFAEAFALATPNADMRLRRGRSALTWGDVALAEAALREALAVRPRDATLRDELGNLLLSFDRTAHAEQLYQRWLREEPDSVPAQLGLARVALKEKDFSAALAQLAALRSRRPAEAEGLALSAVALTGLGRDAEAGAVYRELVAWPERRGDALIGLGRLARRAGRAAEADEFFREALQRAPASPTARFFAAGPARVREESFLARLIAPADGAAPTAPRLLEWAGLYAEEHEFARAIRCLQAAGQADPEFFPAAQQRAELLAIHEEFDAARVEFARLRATIPESRQLRIGEARALAWARRYEPALDAYAQLVALDPEDPGPRREAARTAGWGKQRARSAELYAAAWRDAPVDRALAAALRPILENAPAPTGTDTAGTADIAAEWRAWVARPDFAEEPFARAERFERDRGALREALPAGARALDELYLELLPTLRIQRTFYLENRGKQLAFDRRFARAESVFRALVAIEPGNEEARFDLSQVQAALGLGARERATLAELTALDANNSLAASALRRRALRSRPVASLEASAWRERGRGELSSLRRDQLAGEIADTWGDQFEVRVGGLLGRERPLTRDGRYAFRGETIEAGGVLSNGLGGSAGFRHREFYDPRIGHADTGQAQLWLNLRDAARVGAGYEKREELTNEFALFQGVRSDNAWLGGAFVINRRLDVAARATSVRYSDDNRGHVVELKPALAWTDHPRIFKTILTLEHRDTERAAEFVRRGPALANIVHPYWTPQNYTRGALTLEWYHDLAREFFVGSEEHVYDLRLGFGTDTESNAGVTFEADWRREWRDRWVARGSLYLASSREWRAAGLRLRLARRF